jgi:dynein heavy chain
VEGLQEELKIKMVEVERQKVETDKLIEKVSYENAIAEEEQAKANIEEEKTNEKSMEAQKLKTTCEVALAKAIPVLELAKEAVNCLQKPAITEMKNLAKPPQGVIYTARVVLILLGEKVSFAEAD